MLHSMSENRKTPKTLRSHRWYGTENMRGFAHRQRFLQMGFRRQDFVGRPVIGIINTWSEMSTCHYHLRERADEVRRGVWKAGGFPVELPALSLGEVMVKPTTMFYRNMLAMETEELLRSHPLDGAILMGGCDKTTPALLMGAFTMDMPCIFVPAGPMLNGKWRDKTIGVGTHTKKYWDELRAGTITNDDWRELEAAMTRSNGTCCTMGTASTMTSIAEALGFSIPGAASIPAVDSAHPRMATDAGERIVEMVWEDLKPSKIATNDAFHNAIVTYAALGGSTNATVHLIAMARRIGADVTLEQMDEIARQVPVLTNLMPSGEYLMEDFHYAGGLNALLSRVSDKLRLDALTITGKTMGENIAGAKVHNDDVILPRNKPLNDRPTVAVLHGNICPDGAIIKPSAASPELLQHTGPAMVFEDYNDLYARIDDDDLDVDENSVLVLLNGGPIGGPGMAEWGDQQIPKKLLAKGVRDMLRISDARMSGTRDGTVILHIAPESAIGGPLALVRTGDMIEFDFANRTLNVLVNDAELDRRRTEWTAPEPLYKRGYGVVFAEHVNQANEGVDFDFLAAPGGVIEPDIN
jgi:dihydroxy-acid dehydratase